MKDRWQIILQIIRFGITGLINTAVHSLVYLLLVELFYQDEVYSAIPAFLTAVLVSYVLNRNWVFGVRGRLRRELPRFLLVALIGFGLNLLAMYIQIIIFGWHHRLALVITVLLIASWSFLANKFWTFGKSHGHQEETESVRGGQVNSKESDRA